MHISLLTPTTSLALLLAWGGLATAEVSTHERIVHETTTSHTIELTPETVLCSAADYSFPALKILIPQLAAITLLDHQNFGAGAPCVAAGQCGLPDGTEPSDILDPYDHFEDVDIVVKAIRVDIVDDEALTCTTSLTERVDVLVRGVLFFHERYADLGSRPYADCAPPTNEEEPGDDYEGGGSDEDTGSDDSSGAGTKSDAYGSGGGDTANAGCATTGASGSGGGLLFLLGLGLMATTRRRRQRS
jgi:MYXO-CTERM domain-containing protein